MAQGTENNQGSAGTSDAIDLRTIAKKLRYGIVRHDVGQVGQHDMCECSFCGQVGHNDDPGNAYAIKHWDHCPAHLYDVWAIRPCRMSKYRKKSVVPVVIEAMRLTEDYCWASWLEDKDLFGKFSVFGDYHAGNRTISRAYILIDTPEGTMRAELGDWIIKGVQGEFYPVKNDIFEATYELVRP